MSIVKALVILVALFFLIACVAFFTSAETAFLSLTRLKVRRMLDEKRKNAKTVARLKDRMDTLLTTVLIGTNFLNSLTSSLATLLAVEIMGDGGVGLSTLIIAFFSINFSIQFSCCCRNWWSRRFQSNCQSWSSFCRR